MKVFLGGTCNGSTWRERIIPQLNVEYFNPVVENWNPECMQEEIRQRQECDICLYVITPRMLGMYSIAEVIDDSNKRPEKTMFTRLRVDGDDRFGNDQWKSLGAVAQMVLRNGGMSFETIEVTALYINTLARALKEQSWIQS